MAVVDAAIAVGGFLGVEGGGLAAGLVGGAAIGAGTGALYSGVTGDGNILNSALTGAMIGGAYGGIGAAAGLTGASGTMFGQYAPAAGGLFSSTPALVPATQAAQNTFAATQAAEDMAAGAAARGELPALTASTAGPATTLGTLTNPATTGLTGGQILGYGLAGSAALSLLGNLNTPKLSSSSTPGQNPSYIRPYTYAANPTNTNYNTNVNGLGSSAEQRYFSPTMTAQPIYKAATGGLTPPPNVDFMGSGAYPMSQQQNSHYAVPNQMPTSAQQVKASYEPDTNPLTGEPISMKKGGKAEDDEEFNFNDLPKAKKEFFLDLMASPMAMPKMPGSDVGAQNSFEKYQMSQMPQGAYGRVSATKILDDDSSLRAGLSGIAMAQPNKHGVTTIPGNIDVGYNKRFGDGNVDLSAFRSINPMPGRGHAQGLNARYTLPFAEGGVASSTLPAYGLNNINPTVFEAVGNAMSQVGNVQPQSSAPVQAQAVPQAPLPQYTMATNPAVRAYNDMIMQKAIQTYVSPNGQIPQGYMPQAANTGSSLANALGLQGYASPQAPSNYDSSLLAQWQAANPHVRSYDASTQRYGAGIPSQAQYDAFKYMKDQEAANALAAQSFNGYSPFFGGDGGGGDGGTGAGDGSGEGDGGSGDGGGSGGDGGGGGGGDGGGGGGGGGGGDAMGGYFSRNQFNYHPAQMARGGLPMPGHLGSYSDGGRMLKGPGDGMSDNIPASIGGKQPARLADGEFVVPADVVSHLGNGSTDAGAKRLYAMMDNVRKARTGTKKQGKQIKAEKYLPT